MRTRTPFLIALALGLLATSLPAQTPQAAPADDKKRQALLDTLMATPADQIPKPAEGQPAFEKFCAGCHRFGELGRDVGPDLTTLNSRFKKKDVLESILWPSRVISDQYESYTIELNSGDFVVGTVVMEDDRRVVLRTAANPDRPVQVPKAQIKKQEKSPMSLMPEGLVDELSPKEINALVAFMLAGAK
jgi:putative heme-binding domain-containing protein